MRLNARISGLILSGATLACTPLQQLMNREFGATQSAQQLDPSEPEEQDRQPRPLVSNAFAYARYVALNLKSHETSQLTPTQVMDALTLGIEQSRVSLKTAIEVLALESSLSVTIDASTSVKRYEEFKFQHGHCTTRGFSAIECCQATAWPLAILPRVSSLSEKTRKEVLAIASDSSLSSPSKQQRLIELVNSGSVSYRLSGLKAWLGVCHAKLSSAPATLSEFYRKHAPDINDSSRWQRALHAKSRAKRGPRRVYMRLDGMLSVAETLNQECSVSETEVILRRPDGALNYWVFDALGHLTPESHFPAPTRGGAFVTALKLAPDSCMGCHYDFVTRQFDQLRVSAELLRLPKTSDLPVRCITPGESIAQDN